MQNIRTYGTRVGTCGAFGFRDRLNSSSKTVLRALAIGVMVVGALVSFDKTADAALGLDSSHTLGTFLGVFDGNVNPLIHVQNAIDANSPPLQGTAVFYAKSDLDNGGTAIQNTGGQRGILSISTNAFLSGTWNFAPDPIFTDPIPLVTILALKAGNQFGLWFYTNLTVTEQHGLFNVAQLHTAIGSAPNISNISVYGSVTVIPLPAALPLFLTALVGLGGLTHRRRKKASAAA